MSSSANLHEQFKSIMDFSSPDPAPAPPPATTAASSVDLQLPADPVFSPPRASLPALAAARDSAFVQSLMPQALVPVSESDGKLSAGGGLKKTPSIVSLCFCLKALLVRRIVVV